MKTKLANKKLGELPNAESKIAAFQRLLTVMHDLRRNCPWDMKQTFETLRILTLEETYELADAILENDVDGIKEEIGDIMLHMAFYAEIAEEQGAFDIGDALHAECDKLIRRHPHVYGDTRVDGEADVKRNWETIKKAEGKSSVLSGIPNSLPAMVKAYRMQEKTAQVGFEWENAHQVWHKVEEELAEFREASEAQTSRADIEEEFGDVLFSLINYARYHEIDPESALERINKKFKTRFEYIETHAPKSLEAMTLQEMDALWDAAKNNPVS